METNENEENNDKRTKTMTKRKKTTISYKTIVVFSSLSSTRAFKVQINIYQLRCKLFYKKITLLFETETGLKLFHHSLSPKIFQPGNDSFCPILVD